MKLETGELMSEGAGNSFHSCCFDSDLDNTAPSKESELQSSSSWWWFHSFFIGEIIWTWIWSLVTFFWAAICKSKKLMKKGNCVPAHLIFFTSWSSLVSVVLYRAKYTHCVVVLCTVVFTLWKDYAHRVGTLWTHRGGHKEGLFAQSRWHLTTIKMRNWGGRRNGFNRTVWISTHHLYKYA